MRIGRVGLLVIVAALFCAPLFVGLGRADSANDESIYSYAVESMLETGDWLNPLSSPTRHIVFLEKPPLKFWIVALPIRLGLLPDDEFGLRFWDACFGGLAFLYVFAIGRRLAGLSCGLFAVAALFTFRGLVFEHGLRGNNMEAALLLAYCGGVYHFLGWADAEQPPARRGHAIAVGLFFCLGFLTKFVAALFLPLTLLAASAVVPETRARVGRDWRTWAGVTLMVCLLAAPWFLYQWVHTGSGLWRVMLGEHVYRRFSASLDPTHLHPWNFYAVGIGESLARAGTAWLVAMGAGLMVVRLCRGPWLSGTVIALWCVLPLALISMGTSKLFHYVYPFVPPLALAAGYAVAWLADTVLILSVGLPRGAASPAESLPVRRDRFERVCATCRSAFDRAVWRRVVRAPAGLRVVWGILSAVALGLVVVSLLPHGRLRVAGVTVARAGSFLRPASLSLLFAMLAGSRKWLTGAIMALVLLVLAPSAAYWAMIQRLSVTPHPLRDAAACVLAVREDEHRAGRPTPDFVAALGDRYYQHQYFLYFRRAGWDSRDIASDDDLAAILDSPGAPRPILLPTERYWAFWDRRVHGQGPVLRRVDLGNVLLLLPGPYARCGPE